MKISAAEEYGLRCLLQLARRPHGQLVTGREIAQNEALTPEYVEKILHRMTKAGLVRGLRGVKGGYVLARPAGEITVGEALRAADGRMIAGMCDRFSGADDRCVHLTDCGLRSVWVALDRQIYGFLNKLPLAALLQQEGEVRIQIQTSKAAQAS
jgi:Rrf2 family protein